MREVHGKKIRTPESYVNLTEGVSSATLNPSVYKEKEGFAMKMKRIIAVVLSILMVLGTISIKGGVQAAGNTVTVKASQIKSCKYCKNKNGNVWLDITEDVNLIIDMDVDLKLSYIRETSYPNINLTIKGSKKLTLTTGVNIISAKRHGGYGVLNLESGSNVCVGIGSAEATISVDEMNIKSGANFTFVNNYNGTYPDTEPYPIECNSFTSSGNLNLKVLRANYCIGANEIVINGGTVTSEVYGSTFRSNKITINSGYLDLKDTGSSTYARSPINASDLVLGSSLYIKEPEGAIWKATKYRSGVHDKNGNIAYHVIIDKKPAGYDNGGSSGNGSGTGSNGGYSNEWVNGKWYNADGTQTYKGTLKWKSNATGWWVEDTDGWYPTNAWQKIDGTWYYFKPDGYMASNEYYNGYWFNKDGSWDDKYLLSWKSNATGWWVEDKSGWWPSSSWLKIDGYWYYFDASGYMVTSQYVDGWWISSDGVCY
ncbi:MAG: hypothetical protein K5865_04925 [Eubacterium sp.]|nr:hypothetical protein [Eubacterium sp.]